MGSATLAERRCRLNEAGRHSSGCRKNRDDGPKSSPPSPCGRGLGEGCIHPLTSDHRPTPPSNPLPQGEGQTISAYFLDIPAIASSTAQTAAVSSAA